MIIDRYDFGQAICGILVRFTKTGLVSVFGSIIRLTSSIYTPLAFPIQVTSNLIQNVKRPFIAMGFPDNENGYHRINACILRQPC